MKITGIVFGMVALASPALADFPPLTHYAHFCNPVIGLRLVREVDAESDEALKEWYVLLDAQGAYVSKCQELGAKPSDPALGDFHAAKQKYFDEVKNFHHLNEDRPGKIQRITKVLRDGGDDDCRDALQEELSMLKNREASLEDVNCDK